ncbi:MAG: hypothetical protein A3J10_03750 [Candidatus Sungbacteria bacterium RIFCSPLOWO2_02_FULL_54_10]|uniref:Uncharacterized protein n=2 Tax=Candidatus Sungiibacteriota TaxID=1817917 RepID=A0A1G2KVX9_9BACT|nr:MAG: hypothetical protein A2679_01770 [Candidatus Sungbacteria bacterium RIFCSPHIGHO2_01_FULL_54_26]OHA02772.1 MAG: hypothetical protein A3C92_00755 [Candidatus Sungbacteria bacterium RIFCSPHIGHO2_02_FULL_53_17]OHA12601.1 MAG: hypothetical protein A3J10_03750 [Candidatus Sungbacteria bacterium RIFCSPLOWO2_02_FULL_54_10]
MIHGLCFLFFGRGEMLMGSRCFFEWDEGNTASVTLKKDVCERIIQALMNDPDARIWRDDRNSRKEMFDESRYVFVAENTNSGGSMCICFVVRRIWTKWVNASSNVVRVINTRPINGHEPILRETPPKRFMRARSLRELLRP